MVAENVDGHFEYECCVIHKIAVGAVDPVVEYVVDPIQNDQVVCHAMRVDCVAAMLACRLRCWETCVLAWRIIDALRGGSFAH